MPKVQFGDGKPVEMEVVWISQTTDYRQLILLIQNAVINGAMVVIEQFFMCDKELLEEINNLKKCQCSHERSVISDF